MSRVRHAVLAVLAVALLATSAVADINAVNGILNSLGGGDVRSLTKAAKQLGDLDIGSLADAVLQDSGIVEKLSGLAGNMDQKVVSNAASAAMERLGPELGNRLEGALGDPDMASKLIGSIGGLGDKGAGAIDGLLGVVGDSDLDADLRSGAIGALGDIGSKGDGGSVTSALEKASKDTDPGVADSAKKALEKLGG